MGNRLLQFSAEIKKTWKTAFYSVVIIGLLVHLYKFTNYLPGRDSLSNMYSDQNVVGSGRWFLTIACGISSYFDLPMLIGVISIFYIAITMILLTELFHMENPVLIALSGGILVTFPGITETFLYEYTADGYMLAMLLAAAAVYATRIREKIGWKAWLSAGVCLCLSCAIYQSYIAFALILVLCHFMYELLENRHHTRTMVLWALKQIVLYAAAMAAYYAIWKLCLQIQGKAANDYQGIGDLGSDLVGTFIRGFPTSIKAVVLNFFHWNFLRYGLTPYSALNMVFLVFCGAIVIAAPIRAGVLKRKAHLGLYLVCWVLFIPCCCIWSFVSKAIVYRPMMLVGLALLYIFALVLFERWAKPLYADLAALLLAVIVFNFGLIANICYYYMNESYEQSYATAIRMMMDIDDMASEYEFDAIGIVGDRRYDEKLQTYDDENQRQTPAAGIDVIGRHMYRNMLFDHLSITPFLEHFLGMELEILPGWQIHEFSRTQQFREMEVWPAEGSMLVEDNVLYIKIHQDS